MENNKMIFANTINELGSFGVVGASECHNFGSTWGCRKDCPVFEEGNCKDAYFDNIKMFIKDGDINDDKEFLEIMSLYEIKLSSEEVDMLFTAWFNSL